MSDINRNEPTMYVWRCKVGTREHVELAPASDPPMRAAVEDAFERIAGVPAEFTFSGWEYSLDEPELAVVENRLPSEEHYREWLLQKAAPELLEALQALVHAVCGETGFANAVRNVSGTAYPWPALDDAEAKARAAIAKAEVSHDPR